MKTLKILACMLVMLGMGQTAQAAFMMTVEDTTAAGSALTISDNGAGDGSALTDAIVFSGAVGNFMLNVNVGAFDTDPNRLHLTTFGWTGLSGGTLEVAITKTGLTNAAALYQYIGALGGALNGSVGYKAWVDTTDSAFGTETLLGDVSDNVAGGFSLDAINGQAWIASGVPYSLTLFATMTLGAGQMGSLDASLTEVPVPAAVWLFGSGLLGLLGFSSRKKTGIAA
ncbi:hypothetical protein [Thiolapillus sp.]|uniref:hypothetical protein n=1 Tax=Thiolapillus sp. TaxID=2017437 RepID=UPI003AF5B825